MSFKKEDVDGVIHRFKEQCKQTSSERKRHHKCKECSCKASFPVGDLKFEQGFVTGALGVTLNTQTYSSNTGGLDLLFLPGNPFSFLLWANVVSDPKLLKNFNVHTMQPRGTGAGPFPDPLGPQGGYTLAETWADDINAVITQLNMTPGNVVLIGHSIAGIWISDYIRKYGQSALKGIVLAACIAEPLTTPFGSTQIVPELLANFFEILTAGLVQDSNGYQTFVGGLQKAINDHTLTTCNFRGDDGAQLGVEFGVFRNQPYLVNTVIAVSAHEPTLNLSPTGPPSITDLNTGVWPFIVVPTLIIQGTNDNDVKPDVAAPALHSSIPGSKLKYMKCDGHILWVDDRKEFNCILYRFLKSLM